MQFIYYFHQIFTSLHKTSTGDMKAYIISVADKNSLEMMQKSATRTILPSAESYTDRLQTLLLPTVVEYLFHSDLKQPVTANMPFQQDMFKKIPTIYKPNAESKTEVLTFLIFYDSSFIMKTFQINQVLVALKQDLSDKIISKQVGLFFSETL